MLAQEMRSSILDSNLSTSCPINSYILLVGEETGLRVELFLPLQSTVSHERYVYKCSRLTGIWLVLSVC